MNRILIRKAEDRDAAAASDVVRSSILELCCEDHKNDSATLDRWLRNKNASGFLDWLRDSEKFTLVAEFASDICGVGLINRTGQLDLCYVKPGMQGRGVGGQMMAALESKAVKWGVTEIRLIATSKARVFYEDRGYVCVGSADGRGVLTDYHYSKALAEQGGDDPQPAFLEKN